MFFSGTLEEFFVSRLDGFPLVIPVGFGDGID